MKVEHYRLISNSNNVIQFLHPDIQAFIRIAEQEEEDISFFCQTGSLLMLVTNNVASHFSVRTAKQEYVSFSSYKRFENLTPESVYPVANYTLHIYSRTII